jgi:hypothetical protein
MHIENNVANMDELISKLKDAKNKKVPVYAASGPCGGCDLLIGELKPEQLNIDDLLGRLSKIQKSPEYPGEAPCGGCDIVIKH